MTSAEKARIIADIKKTIENESSCTIGEAYYKETKLSSDQRSEAVVDQIEAELRKSHKYQCVKRSYKHGYDFTVSLDPGFELHDSVITTNRLMRIFTGIVAGSAILALLVGIATLCIQIKELHRKQTYHRYK